ncbi:MAG: SH3 domain-containing protein [Anaerolineae bacterium]
MSQLKVRPSNDNVRLRQAPVDGAPIGQVHSRDVLEVLDAAEEAQAKIGKADQWIKVRTEAGLVGYVSAGFLKVEVGFQAAPAATTASTSATQPAAAASTPAPSPAPAATQPAAQPVTQPAVSVAAPSANDETRIRRAAFAITAAFEGHGYAAFQNFDSGVISYGRFQFTLSGGSLVTVVNNYLAVSTSKIADDLRANYQQRISAKDETLRGDAHLKELLVMAASEKEMQNAQDEAARVGYWQQMLDLSATPRGLQLPLSLALGFDMAINHGLRHQHFGNAETALGVQPRSMVGINGLTEQQLITEVAKQRRDFMYRFAEKNNFPGLKVRGDFWAALVAKGDWNLQGDVNGNVNVNGKTVQVRNP